MNIPVTNYKRLYFIRLNLKYKRNRKCLHYFTPWEILANTHRDDSTGHRSIIMDLRHFYTAIGRM